MAVERQGFDLLTNLNFGSIIIGLAVSLVLFGAAFVQGCIYYRFFSPSCLRAKLSAVLILSLESAHSCLITYMVYRNIILLQGSTPAGPNSYALTASIIPGLLVAVPVQGFSAFRIYRLSGFLAISIICWAMSLMLLTGGFVLIAKSFIDVPRVPNTVTIVTTYSWLVTLVFTIWACTDILITGSLCYWLKRLTPNEPSRVSSDLVNSLVVWVIQTGALTSIGSLSSLIMFHVQPNSEIWFAIYMATAKLYSNSFFASLNMRYYYRYKNIRESRPNGVLIDRNTIRHQVSTINSRDNSNVNENLTVPRLPSRVLSLSPVRKLPRNTGPSHVGPAF
ncbi:hypothetical protein BDZ94DRAFT_257299 [Collybia nuda]|uniref:DUF6534 domain-containing protein n=1 Tax=Collybia nuda TaxID=64659 RepID=A0A9P6CDM2_9AGAR|nr:hypothetical protein BDZ94DRAFT_257299 [Collybia nuda]